MAKTPDTYRARKLRRETNLPEQKAWQVLRKLRPLGYPVRRQHPIGGYFVDFAIVKARLIIEVDGSVHNQAEIKARDAERQAYLESVGWKVLRVSAETALSGDLLWERVTAELGL